MIRIRRCKTKTLLTRPSKLLSWAPPFTKPDTSSSRSGSASKCTPSSGQGAARHPRRHAQSAIRCKQPARRTVRRVLASPALTLLILWGSKSERDRSYNFKDISVTSGTRRAQSARRRFPSLIEFVIRSGVWQRLPRAVASTICCAYSACLRLISR
jgi:hypothetical protein